MLIPKIIYSDKIIKWTGFSKNIAGKTLWPFIVLKDKYNEDDYWIGRRPILLNHETIHIKQQGELLLIGFLIIYILEWLIRLIQYRDFKKAYRNISFEREAYTNQHDFTYLDTRPKFQWINYLHIKG